MYFEKSKLSLPLCYWSMRGQLLVNVAKSMAERGSVGLRQATGNLVGLSSMATGRMDTTGGILK